MALDKTKQFPEIAEALASGRDDAGRDGLIVDGEIVALDEAGAPGAVPGPAGAHARDE